MINYTQRDEAYKQAMIAMNGGVYVTIIYYCYHAGKTRIEGLTFKNGNLQEQHTIKFQ
jgi:hypothetical protein